MRYSLPGLLCVVRKVSYHPVRLTYPNHSHAGRDTNLAAPAPEASISLGLTDTSAARHADSA